LLSDNSSERLKRVIGTNKYLIIDEAQEIEEIGKKNKKIYFFDNGILTKKQNSLSPSPEIILSTALLL